MRPDLWAHLAIELTPQLNTQETDTWSQTLRESREGLRAWKENCAVTRIRHGQAG